MDITFTEGTILEFEESPSDLPYADVPALLFTAGTHKGRSYTDKDLHAIAESFRPPTGDRDWDVPVQADHSDSALNTLGHVRSVTTDGKSLQGVLRFFGDAVERVRDGRFRKLSVGLRLHPKPSLREVSVTPFPHLRDAKIFKEESMNLTNDKAADATPDPAPTAPDSAAPSQSEGKDLVAMREEFEARTRALEEKLAEQEKMIRFKERADLVVTFMEAGKTVPAMKDKELALLEALSDEQLALYRELKEAQPSIVEFRVYGEQHVSRPGGPAPAEASAQADDLLKRYSK